MSDNTVRVHVQRMAWKLHPSVNSQGSKAAADTAKAIKEEKDNAARAIKEEKDSAAEVLKNEREATATALLKESTETNSKWAPRMGSLTFALVFTGIIGALVTFYATFHK